MQITLDLNALKTWSLELLFRTVYESAALANTPEDTRKTAVQQLKAIVVEIERRRGTHEADLREQLDSITA